MLNKSLEFITRPGFKSVFAALVSDPSPAKSWREMYDNIIIRFILIFIVIYQSTSNIYQSLSITLLTIAFDYIISSEKEKNNVLNNNFRKKDLRSLCYFIGYLIIMYQFGLL